MDVFDPFVCDSQPPEKHETSLIWKENSCRSHVVARPPTNAYQLPGRLWRSESFKRARSVEVLERTV